MTRLMVSLLCYCLTEQAANNRITNTRRNCMTHRRILLLIVSPFIGNHPLCRGNRIAAIISNPNWYCHRFKFFNVQRPTLTISSQHLQEAGARRSDMSQASPSSHRLGRRYSRRTINPFLQSRQPNASLTLMTSSTIPNETCNRVHGAMD